MNKTVGILEKVSFPDLGIIDVDAKIDTGAYSGALHATKIHEVNLPTGERAVSFVPFTGKDPIVVSDFGTVRVKSSDGQVAERYVVPTVISIRGVQYPIRITLADRSPMKRPVLIGRKFLREHGFIVDPNGASAYLYEGK